MKKRIVGYRERIDALLTNLPEGTDWDIVLREHLTQVSFFQHERLIHLIVTVTFAILTMIVLAIYCIAEYIPMLALIVLLLVLLVPYIGHYYTLENEVQKMYGQYDQIVKIMHTAACGNLPLCGCGCREYTNKINKNIKKERKTKK